MVKVLPGPAFEFTVNGEEVKRLIGRNTTGERVWRGHPGAFGHELAAYYAAIAQSRRPAGCRGDLGFVGRDFLRFESVDCPLLGPDGEVSHIVGVMDAA